MIGSCACQVSRTDQRPSDEVFGIAVECPCKAKSCNLADVASGVEIAVSEPW